MSQHENPRRRGRMSAQRDSQPQRKSLADMHSHESGTIETIGEEIRHQLSRMGIRPGKKLVVHAKQPFSGPITVSVGQNMTSLSHEHARHIEIAIADE